MLEPYEWKRSRTVLRRESGSNPADLVDYGGEKAERVGIANVEYGESLRGRREICIATYEDMETDDCTRYLRVDSHGKIKIEK